MYFYQNCTNFIGYLTKKKKRESIQHRLNLTTVRNVNKETVWKVCDQISVVTLTRENGRYWRRFRDILQTSRRDSYGGQRREAKEHPRSWKFSRLFIGLLRALSASTVISPGEFREAAAAATCARKLKKGIYESAAAGRRCRFPRGASYP